MIMPDQIKYAKSAPNFSVIEPAQAPALVAVIADGLKEEGAHKSEIFDQSFWDWQYRRLPTGRAQVYAAFIDGKIAGYYHVPIYRMMIGGRPGLAGVPQDVAVRPWAQGRGVFRGLAAFANADLARSGLDLIYTFPNKRSIHNFLKYDGYRKVLELGAWLMPVDSAAILRREVGLVWAGKWLGAAVDGALNGLAASLRDECALKTHAAFDAEILGLFAPRAEDKSLTLLRDAEYLKWRFLDRPKSKHSIYSLREGGRATAAAVFKHECLFGIPALLLMDFATLPGRESDMVQLLLRLRLALREDGPAGMGLIFAAGAHAFAPHPLSAGFIPIPGPVNPRRIGLLCKNFSSSDDAAASNPKRWHINLSDWDVF